MASAAIRLVLHNMKAANSGTAAVVHSDIRVHDVNRGLHIVTGYGALSAANDSNVLQQTVVDMLQQLGISCNISAENKGLLTIQSQQLVAYCSNRQQLEQQCKSLAIMPTRFNSTCQSSLLISNICKSRKSSSRAVFCGAAAVGTVAAAAAATGIGAAAFDVDALGLKYRDAPKLLLLLLPPFDGGAGTSQVKSSTATCASSIRIHTSSARTHVRAKAD
eukprot:13661-Heterococcus_DN1.PRE.1